MCDFIYKDSTEITSEITSEIDKAPEFPKDLTVFKDSTVDLDVDTISKVTNTCNNINTCVVGITSTHPYDTSTFMNNSTTFYTQITYLELIKLYDLINLPTHKTIIKTNKQTKTDTPIDMNLIYVANCFSDLSVKMIFRFLCSSDCADGKHFINHKTTLKVYDFVKFVTKRNCIIEVSDHSMGSFFNNWNKNTMGIPSPIKILPITHSDGFKIYGNKSDFIESIHPTLKQIGNLSLSEAIEITFNNLTGTKVYKIIGQGVKVISKGVQIKNTFEFEFEFEYGKRHKEKSSDLYEEVPVHCEFDFQDGKIVVSATHWCNLDSVETPIDLKTLRRYCTNSLGDEATQDLERSLSSAQNEREYKRIISTTVRQISSGSKNNY
jgi:hypothetical protein